jgi:isoleucyl-tRNA synthetase
MNKYPEYSTLNLPKIAEEVLADWDRLSVFEKSVSSREGATPFVFYEGPPSANGMPGIHHVMSRTLKDIFCRWQTLQGKQVRRKAGWDTHGLPIELSVEKELGITKEDIGKKISVDEYNHKCRETVMRYTDRWEALTRQMGYWVDMQNPYITYENKYIESVWWLLQQLYKKELLYKGYTIQPYSPAAGTGLSSHELNQPGCYRPVKDRSAIAMFRVKPPADDKNKNAAAVFQTTTEPVYILAWTTTPWTLPSNTALAVGNKIQYVLVKTINPFSHQVVSVVLAKDLLEKYFPGKNAALKFEDYKAGDKNIPFAVLGELNGADLVGLRYEQLLPYVLPYENSEAAFQVIAGDFVTTSDGTGIVHIAPTFGADDMRAAKAAGVPPMLVMDENEKLVPLVDLRGKFRSEVNDPQFGLAGEFVKEDYLSAEEKAADLEKQKQYMQFIISDTSKLSYLSVDERIVLKLQNEGKLFKKESYEHNYPHCWRTDKPVLYYPLDSWFIRASAKKERMAELNQTIGWRPESTGTGRFGEWLNNLQDWNLSRSRYWGIPLPIWRDEDETEELCIGSVEELKAEIDRSIAAGFMTENPLAKFTVGDFSKENYEGFDLHRPYSDNIVLERNGKKLFRETDLIDVWFDSGAMPYAQLHYPFENKVLVDERKYFPADYIAEGVDQTRGWFYTLHAIGVMLFDNVAYKNVISNGLVLDKNGNKMSKRLGNAADPFDTLNQYGPDATRWYMISNADPWDNLKFDPAGITEIQRSLFGTLYNTYSFFALYANIDGFVVSEKNQTKLSTRPELDRWIISKLNSLVKTVSERLNDYDPTPAARAIEDFVDAHLSNWYVRLSRRRFWKGELTEDKQSAYATLHECLSTLAQLMAPFAPFFADRLFRDLNAAAAESVHLSLLPAANMAAIDLELEARMQLAQQYSTLVHSIRKRKDVNIRARQPLGRIMVPVLDDNFRNRMEQVKHLLLAEVNVKEVEYVTEAGVFVKKIKANFQLLGKKLGKQMKAAATAIAAFSQEDIALLEQQGYFDLQLEGETTRIERNEVEILVDDVPGWQVATDGRLTVALDTTITENLREEGLARELVNRIQNLRKDKNFEVTDKISVKISANQSLKAAVNNNFNYICSETLATSLEIVPELSEKEAVHVDLDEENKTYLHITKQN